MPLACDRAWAIQVWIAFIRAGDTDVCAVATEPLASHATIRTGAAKIDIDAPRLHFGMFDILGLPIVGAKRVPLYALGGGSVGAHLPRNGERCRPFRRHREPESIPDARTSANDRV